MLTTAYTSGSPNWLDLGSPDTDAAARFYRAVFGWECRSAGQDSRGYGLFRKDGKTVAALGPLTEQGADPAWTIYFRTDDADATARAVQNAGGTVRAAPFDVMKAGRIACLTDPEGGQFSVWQPGEVAGLDLVGLPGALCWLELASHDAGDFAFYSTVFDWHAEAMEVPGTTYTVLSPADGDPKQDSFGHVTILQGGHRPCWLPYFWVEEVDGVVDAICAHGGSVTKPATDASYLGRMAVVADPSGAPFAVTTPKPAP
ncbi:VOC family protein [Nocardia transvalensis]|uniref:VOC family protein n=1 Tax=Nocardia transvalensis TaxID=37333 RepID=UPI0018940952|nr:VOC family protein [Nocardia transvalensis]MBF6328040.1 VOC family protein [Nocardia transvalensis]